MRRIKTKPFTGTFSGLNNKYLVGEIDLAFMNVSYVLRNRSKGMPTEFRNLDLIYTYYQHLLVAKAAKHPNAARLLAIFLTSPDGVKFVEKLDPATIHPRVSGSLMSGIYQEGLKEGLKPVTVYTYPGMVEFMASPDYEKWQKEAQLIIKGAG